MESKDLLVILLIPFEFLFIFFYIQLIRVRNIFRWIFPTSIVNLKGEIVLVTGGGNGIGRAVCQRLVEKEKDLTIIIWDINEKASLDTVKELKASGVSQAFAFNVDVSRREEVESAADQIRDEIGDVTILFNNAGVSGNATEAWTEVPAVIERVFAVNVISHAWTLREFLPSMIEKGRGHVVETSSALGILPSPSVAAYVASKFALRGYVESIKQDIRLLPSKPKIFFSLVYPNYVLTQMTEKVDFSDLRYKMFFQPITARCMAGKMVDGMLHRKEHIYSPFWSPLIYFFHSITPSEAINKYMDFIGVTSLHIDLMNSNNFD